MNFKDIFHYISYLQYPLPLVAFYFALSPYFEGVKNLQENPDLISINLNSMLIFMGVKTAINRNWKSLRKKIFKNNRK